MLAKTFACVSVPGLLSPITFKTSAATHSSDTAFLWDYAYAASQLISSTHWPIRCVALALL